MDDFAVASSSDSINKDLISAINNEPTIEIKDLGELTRYNGVDVTQGRHFVKLSNKTYFDKVIEEHPWLQNDTNISNKPLPLHSDKSFNHLLEHAVPPPTELEQNQLQTKMGLNYRQGIGELIYMMVTCRPDISFPLIKLSQYSSNPAEEHYVALKQFFEYLQATSDDGIYFWRPTPQSSLPIYPMPSTSPSNYTNHSMDLIDHPRTLQ